MAGIKNIKDVLDLIEVIGVEIATAVGKDGFQPADLVVFLNSESFNAKIQEAVLGWEQLGDEATDIGIIEGVELAAKVKNVVSNIAAASKGKLK
jgi:hypothetical protein